MKLSASNIAWPFEQDGEMLALLKSLRFDGLEIAPTRLFPEAPYTHSDQAQSYAAKLLEQYGLRVSSMQSILFGITQNLFGSKDDRAFLRDYLFQAIDFAKGLGCDNLVFGCPKNRIMGDKSQYGMAVEFFSGLGEYAVQQNTVLSIEAVPVIYGANFLNITAEACAFVRDVGHPGCMVNADTGTMVYNDEPFSVLERNADLIHHIHLSEPNLAPIHQREWHKRLRELPFEGYLSLEMRNTERLEDVQDALAYLREVAA